MGGVVGGALGGVAGATFGGTADAFGNIGSAEREKQRNDAINAAKNKAWEDSEAQLNARDAALKPWETAQLRYDQAGRPKYVQAKSLIDPTTGLLMDQYNLKAENLLEDTQNDLSKINLNTDALKELRKRGLSTGNSEWANLMLQKAELDQKSQREGMVKSQATAGAQARSALASRGGLRGGSCGANSSRRDVAGSTDEPTAWNAGRSKQAWHHDRRREATCWHFTSSPWNGSTSASTRV